MFSKLKHLFGRRLDVSPYCIFTIGGHDYQVVSSETVFEDDEHITVTMRCRKES